jgi:microcystin-dependent protein
MSRHVHRIVFSAVVGLAAIPGASACQLDAYMGNVCTFAFAGSVGGPPGCPSSGGWVPADGALLPIKGNEKLFELLQTTYGGDGTTTFGLPDLRGRVVTNAGKGPGLADVKMGETFGTEELKFAIENLPPHDHTAVSVATIDATLRAQNAGGSKPGPASNVPAKLSTTTSSGPAALAAPQIGVNGYMAITGLPPGWGSVVEMHASAIASDAKVTTTTGATGGGQPLGNMQAALVMSQCIRINGPVPPRP